MFFRIIMWILFILLFLPAFRLPVSGFQVCMFFLVLLPFLIFVTVIKPTYMLKNIILLYKNTPFKYFVFFAMWTIADSIYLVCAGTMTLFRFVHMLIMVFVCLYFASYFLPIIMINRFFSLKKFIKYFIIAVYILLILGLFFYIGYALNINLIQIIHSTICNERFLSFDESSGLDISYVEKVRTSSTFAEAGYYGEFLFFISPIIYNLVTSKYKLFKNDYFNAFIKYTIFPLIIISVLLTKSPIWFIFYGILLLYLTRKNLINFIKKQAILVFLIMTFLFVSFITDSEISTFIIQNPIFKRMNNTIESMGDFHSFAIIEGSLANRIISYKVAYIMFTQHVITGVGHSNIGYHTYNIIQEIDLPLTKELQRHLQNFYYTGKMNTNSSVLFSTLASSGIPGFILFYLFLIKTCQYINIVQKQCYGIEKIFFQQLRVAIIAVMIISFYSDLMIISYIYWFFFGLCNPFLLQKKYIMLSKNQLQSE